MHPGDPISDEDLVVLANALAGLRREVTEDRVVISTTVDVDPGQRFGPWQAVVEAVRAGVATLHPDVAGTLLERAVPAIEDLRDVLPVVAAAAETSRRSAAFDAAVTVAVDDASALASRIGGDDPDLLVAIEAAYAAVLAACYGTWVVRDIVDLRTAGTGLGLVDTVLRPLDAFRRLHGDSAAAAVLDVAEALPVTVWEQLAMTARARSSEEAMASVRLRSRAAVSGLGGAEVAAVAQLAPDVGDLGVVADAALVVGDAALAAAALVAEDVVDLDTCALARRAWEEAAPPA